MQPRIDVRLTEQIGERLAAAAKRPGASKTAIVEAALARFFDVDGEANENGVLLSRLNSISRQLEQLDLELKIVSETVALHARYLLSLHPYRTRISGPHALSGAIASKSSLHKLEGAFN